MVLYAFVLLVSTYIFSDSKLYATGIGMISAGVEGFMGVPQLHKNYVNKSTKGLSLIFILIWIAGDGAKVVYNMANNEPVPLIISAALQLTVDFLILGQISIYSETKKDQKEN